MRKLAGVAVAVAAAATLGGVAVGATNAVGPTGNHVAIVYARAVAKTYGHVPAVAFTRTGYVEIHSRLGKASGFSWSWGTGIVPRGWVRATEHAVVGLTGGRIAWFTDVLQTPACGVAVCADPPVKIVVTRHGGYWRFDLRRSKKFPACYRRLRGSTPLTVGGRFVSVGGHFRPLILQGLSVLTNYTYAWDGSQTATETDTISVLTGLVTATHIQVSKGSGRYEPRFAFTATYQIPKTAKRPKFKVC